MSFTSYRGSPTVKVFSINKFPWCKCFCGWNHPGVVPHQPGIDVSSWSNVITIKWGWVKNVDIEHKKSGNAALVPGNGIEPSLALLRIPIVNRDVSTNFTMILMRIRLAFPEQTLDENSAFHALDILFTRVGLCSSAKHFTVHKFPGCIWFGRKNHFGVMTIHASIYICCWTYIITVEYLGV